MNFSAVCISLVILHPGSDARHTTVPNTSIAYIGCTSPLIATVETASVQPRFTPRLKKTKAKARPRFGIVPRCGRETAFWYQKRRGHWYYKCI